VEVVVPAYRRADLLARCLDSLGEVPVVVVDDASPTPDVSQVARARGARVVRHGVNQGPAAARNSGLAVTTADLIAFVDADCVAVPGWLEALVPLFEDERVGAVAPRVVPRSTVDSLLARHERARSALDMGRRRALVRPGGPLGFLPSATLVVRRDAVRGGAFDAALRLGEDVDLVWRLADQGWHVRYEPSVTIEHAMRLGWRAWARRRFEYGTSAAALDHRHPGRLAPARVSAWNLASLAALVAGRPGLGGAVATVASILLASELAARKADPLLAPVVVAKGLFADGVSVGHALRREWWPLGWLALAAATRSRLARGATAAMLVPVVIEWWRDRPEVDAARYGVLRLVEDAAYGSGVLASALRMRRPATVAPQIRAPYVADAVRRGLYRDQRAEPTPSASA
jgi:mycofactocin system glycosyltransferase